MASKSLTVTGAVTAALAGVALLLRESVGWLVGKALDHLPLPRAADGAVNWQVIPWLNILAFALLALGVYLFWRGGRMQAAEAPEADDPYLSVTADCYRISQYITKFRATRSIYRSDLPDLVPVIREGLTAIISLQKFGFEVPRLNTGDGAKLAVGLEYYLGSMAALLNGGHSDVALRDAGKIAEKADSISENLDPQTWWTHRDW